MVKAFTTGISGNLLRTLTEQDHFESLENDLQIKKHGDVLDIVKIVLMMGLLSDRMRAPVSLRSLRTCSLRILYCSAAADSVSKATMGKLFNCFRSQPNKKFSNLSRQGFDAAAEGGARGLGSRWSSKLHWGFAAPCPFTGGLPGTTR